MTNHFSDRSATFGSATGQAPLSLRILATSDLHATLRSWDYHADRPAPGIGLSRTAGLIAQARREEPNSLLFDNGDFLTGNPLADFVAATADRRRGRVNPVIAAMNRLRYDAAALGNHEFSEGIPFLEAALRHARFPVVAANIAYALGPDPNRDAHYVPPFALLRRRFLDHEGVFRPVNVGVIGFLPPQTTIWDAHHLSGRLVTRGILEAAEPLVQDLRARGADLVVALAHSGIGTQGAGGREENVAQALALVPGIDVLVAGHTHLAFPSPAFADQPGLDTTTGTIEGRPAVMPGSHGSHLGVIDVTLAPTKTGWRVGNHRVDLRPVAVRGTRGALRPLTPAAPLVARAILADHAAARNWAGAVIGESAITLHSYFALVRPCPALALVALAQRDHVARLVSSGPDAGLPVLSAVAPYKAGGRAGAENFTEVPAGSLRRRHLFDLYPHPNTIAALRMNGAGIAEWLERSASAYHQILPLSRDAPLLDPNFPSFNVDWITGLSYRIDLSVPPRFDGHGQVANPSSRRIRDLMLDGVPLAPDRPVILATNSYRAGGGGGFLVAGSGTLLFSGKDLTRDVLAHHLETGGGTCT